MVFLWYPTHDIDAELDRFGGTMARNVAHMSAANLLHKDRIELAVLANELVGQPEIAGVIFYDTTNAILAMSGTNELLEPYMAPGTLDDTITGYVSIGLRDSAFDRPFPIWAWVLSLLVILFTPYITVATIQISSQGNRSLPIVTVPETPSQKPQESFAIYVNLHNALALDLEARAQAIEDAVTMAREVVAIHHGVATTLKNRGVLLLFDRKSVDADQAICGSALIQTLLAEFETQGEFRCYLDTLACPAAPSEMDDVELETMADSLSYEDQFTRAAMAKHGDIIFSAQIVTTLGETTKRCIAPFEHPLIDEDSQGLAYTMTDLPESMAELVANQSQLILGFT